MEAAALSGKISVNKHRKVITGPGSQLQVKDYWLYLTNFDETGTCPIHVGGDTVNMESGIVIPGGPLARKMPVALCMHPDAILYAIAEEGKESVLGYLILA